MIKRKKKKKYDKRWQIKKKKKSEEIELEMERNFSAVAMVTRFDYLSTIDIHQSIKRRRRRRRRRKLLFSLLCSTPRGAGERKRQGRYRPTKRKKEIGRMDGKKREEEATLVTLCHLPFNTARLGETRVARV